MNKTQSVYEQKPTVKLSPNNSPISTEKDDDKRTDSESYMSLQVNQTPFIQKLYSMLEDASLDEFIHWSPTEDSFFINAGERFSQILCLYFRHTNIASFVRQLSMYGFHKVSQHSRESTRNRVGINEETAKMLSNFNWEFRHVENAFKRNDFEALRGIRRRVGNRSKKKFQRHIVITNDTHSKAESKSPATESTKSIHIYEDSNSNDKRDEHVHSHTYHYITMNNNNTSPQTSSDMQHTHQSTVHYHPGSYTQTQTTSSVPVFNTPGFDQIHQHHHHHHNQLHHVKHESSDSSSGQVTPALQVNNGSTSPQSHPPSLPQHQHQHQSHQQQHQQSQPQPQSENTNEELLGNILAKQSRFQEELKDVNNHLLRLGQNAAEIGLMAQLLRENQVQGIPNSHLSPLLSHANNNLMHMNMTNIPQPTTTTPPGGNVPGQRPQDYQFLGHGNSLSTGHQMTAYRPHTSPSQSSNRGSDGLTDRTSSSTGESNPDSAEDNSSSGSERTMYSGSRIGTAKSSDLKSVYQMDDPNMKSHIQPLLALSRSPIEREPVKGGKNKSVQIQSLLN